METNTVAPPPGFELDEDIQPPEGFELDEPTPQLYGKATPFIQKAGNFLSTPLKAIENIPGYQAAKIQVENTPIGLGQKAFNVIGQTAGKLGEKTAESLAQEGFTSRSPFVGGENIKVSPETAARIGTGIQMAPDIIGLAVAPIGGKEMEPSVPKPPLSVPPVSPSAPPVSTMEGLASKVKGAIPPDVMEPLGEVKNYLSSKYGQAAKKPGMAQTAADYLKEHAQNMTLKELGAAPGQVRKIGVDRAHELADYALDNNLAGPSVGSIGRGKAIAQNLENAGGAVGAFRKMAADRGAVVDPDALINQIKSQLDQKYLTGGLRTGDKSIYLKSLDELKKAGGRADDISNKITEMFQESKKLDRLKRPSGPVADVARQAREINHNMIKSNLSPEEMNLYEKALEDYGALTQLNEFVKRRGSVEAGGRLGPGAGISRAAVQKFLDSVGYRTEAKIASKLSDFIRKNPDVMSKPQNLFRQYIDEAAEAIDEMVGEHGQ